VWVRGADLEGIVMNQRNQDSRAWRGACGRSAQRARGADGRRDRGYAAQLRGLAVGVGLGLVAAGCDAGSTLGSVSLGDDTPPAYDYANDGPIVAKVVVLAPEAQSFMLQATIPVPPGTYVRGETLVPLAVLTSSDTTAVPTQVEVVTNYPHESQGAAVVEVTAHVRRPDVPVGTPIEYEVAFHPHAPRPFQLSESVESLLSAPNSLLLRSKDVFGHTYQFDLLADHRTGNGERVREGALVNEHKTSGSLMPLTPVTGPQATLPHMMGVHAYVRTFDREDFFALDLHLHNGFDGRDASTPSDDVLDELHFERLGLRLPGGWRIIDSVPNPYTGTQVLSQTMQEYDIVGPLAGGRLHVMLRQGQFWRRLMIARDAAAEARARVHLERGNLGFCQPGQSQSGAELWSWWNRDTARYLPQAHRRGARCAPEPGAARDDVDLSRDGGEPRLGAPLGRRPRRDGRRRRDHAVDRRRHRVGRVAGGLPADGAQGTHERRPPTAGALPRRRRADVLSHRGADDGPVQPVAAPGDVDAAGW